MYEPVRIPWGRPSRRRIWVTVVLVVASLTAIAVTVVRTMPHHPPAEPFTLDDLALMMPDAHQTQLVAAIVRARIANAKATPKPSTTPQQRPSVLRRTLRTSGTAPSATTPRRSSRSVWRWASRSAAWSLLWRPRCRRVSSTTSATSAPTTITIPVGLFQQRPSMGLGIGGAGHRPGVFRHGLLSGSATGFRLESMEVTVAAQRVQRSRFPNAYAKWETSASLFSREILCTETAGRPASSA